MAAADDTFDDCDSLFGGGHGLAPPVNPYVPLSDITTGTVSTRTDDDVAREATVEQNAHPFCPVCDMGRDHVASDKSTPITELITMMAQLSRRTPAFVPNKMYQYLARYYEDSIRPRLPAAVECWRHDGARAASEPPPGKRRKTTTTTTTDASLLSTAWPMSEIENHMLRHIDANPDRMRSEKQKCFRILELLSDNIIPNPSMPGEQFNPQNVKLYMSTLESVNKIFDLNKS